MKKLARRKGFTLVELIVVIAILAILAGVAIPVYSGYIKKANEAADLSQLDSVKTACVFAATEKAVPESFEVTTIKVTASDGTISAIQVTGKAGATNVTYKDADDLDNAILNLLGGEYPKMESATYKNGATYQKNATEGKWEWVPNA